MTRAIDPRTGEAFGPDYEDATPLQLDVTVRRAAVAFDSLRSLAPTALAVALRAAADALDTRTNELVEIADAETALGRTRLTGEVARTTHQFRMFADLVTTGEHLDAVITYPPAGAPAKDLRRVNRPLGVVAVFGASNFPLAFGVAGGDTASALAAGCPVVAKAHPAHPGTSELVAETVAAALVKAGLPEGTFQFVHGAAPAVGTALVTHPQVAAVGFTGSTTVGRALFDLGVSRPAPIPVYAEQGSLNPVVLAPSALEGAGLGRAAAQLSSAVTAGWGQFCTKPGVLIAPAERADALVEALTDALGNVTPGFLLTPGIRAAFLRNVERAASIAGIRSWQGTAAERGLAVPAVVLRTDAATFVEHEALREELFGPAVVVVAVTDRSQVADVVAAIGGSLTGTVHGSPDDVWVRTALEVLEPRVGRVVANGVPTGVAVVPAMQHGGPYPSSTSAAHTSVGTAAIRRFLRPVTYQDFPDGLLPPSLAETNPWGISRRVDGHRTTDHLEH